MLTLSFLVFFAAATPVQSSDCATCHDEVVKNFAGAAHAQACVGCHQPTPEHMESPSKQNVTRVPKSEACGSCHAQQRAKFDLPYTHRRGKTAFACTDCHSIHGEGRTARLSMLQNSGACSECHADAAAPRVFEHPPQRADGCISCHDAHGSANPRLLVRRNVSDLCLECHTDVARFHDLSTSKYRVCVSCHAAVHGSNRDAHLFNE